MNEFLNKISQLYSKDILFASLLPLLMFLISVLMVFTDILGYNNVLLLYGGFSTNATLFLTFSTFLLLIVFSYILNSIRSTMLQFWSGNSLILAWYFEIATIVHSWNFSRRKNESEHSWTWAIEYQRLHKVILELGKKKIPGSKEVKAQLMELITEIKTDDPNSISKAFTELLNAFATCAPEHFDEVKRGLSKNINGRDQSANGYNLLLQAYENFKKELEAKQTEIDLLIKKINGFEFTAKASEIKELFTQIGKAYKEFRPERFNEVHVALFDKNEVFQKYHQSEAVLLDKQYGSLGSIRGTRLGNIIQSYNEYPFNRYRMEAEIFWPRLQAVIKDSVKETIRDQRISLDFSVTLATLALLFTFLCALGPWIYMEPFYWMRLGFFGLVVAFLSYEVAVSAAFNLGELIRSAYDLYRLELLKSLNLKFPKNKDDERSIWSTYSQHIAFGESEPFEYKASKE